VNVLDPATPFPYLLYSLAGAGVVAYVLPQSLERLSQLERDLYAAHPPLKAFAALVMWAIWPLLAFFVALEAIARVALWFIDLFDSDDSDDDGEDE
jgi:hypothetical protein